MQHCIITKLTIILKLFFYYAYDYIITVYILGQLNEPLKENKGSNNIEKGERWTELRIHPCYNCAASWHSSRRKEKNSSRVLSVNPAHKSENCNAAEVGHLACLSKLKIKCVFCSQMWWIAEEFCNMWVFKSSSAAHKAPSPHEHLHTQVQNKATLALPCSFLKSWVVVICMWQKQALLPVSNLHNYVRALKTSGK